MRTGSAQTQRIVSALIAAALAAATGSVAAEEDPYARLPGEPPVQPATGSTLAPADAIQYAVDWAKFGKDPDASKMIDAAITAISIGYPPAGAALGIAKGFITALGGSGPDPVQEALKIMDQRITQLEKNVQALDEG